MCVHVTVCVCWSVSVFLWSQRSATVDIVHLSLVCPGAKANPTLSCGAMGMGLRQTGSFYKGFGLTWIHWLLSKVLVI